MQTSAPPTENSFSNPAYALFSADRLRWLYASRADVLGPYPYLEKILIEPAPEGGVYLVASNAALIMIAYDADGIANGRFTFDAAEAVANLAGFPEDETRLFQGGNAYANTIIIDGGILHACIKADRDAPATTVLSHPTKIGREFPDWHSFTQVSGERHNADAWVDVQQIALALAGIPEGPHAIRIVRYTTTGHQNVPDLQPIHFEFDQLPLRGVLMPVKGMQDNPIACIDLPFDTAAKPQPKAAPPQFAIPALAPGERYAGIVIAPDNGQPTHHLVLLPEQPTERLNWDDATAWAASIGGELPTRQEAALLFANVKTAFEPEWHWTSEQYAGYASYAWLQYFLDGGQYYGVKGYKGRVRAVRRFLID